MTTLVGGLLQDPRITSELRPNIEHGAMDLKKVIAIVIHQTDSSTAYSALEAWKTRPYGAHFLIDRGGAEYRVNGKIQKTEDGKIYQTARLDRVCWHVGKIRSKCLATLTCDIPKGQKKSIEEQNKGNLSKMSALETKKSYPSRYPINSDSIGIEIVTKYDVQAQRYPDPTLAQAVSALWLISTLGSMIPGISPDSVYTHGEISYKDPRQTEGSGVWRAAGQIMYPFSLLIGRPIGLVSSFPTRIL